MIWLSRIDDEQKCSRPFVLAVDYYDFFYFIDRRQDIFLPWHLTATRTHTYVAYEGSSIKWYVTTGMYNQKPLRDPHSTRSGINLHSTSSSRLRVCPDASSKVLDEL